MIPPSTCANCGAERLGAFCQNCGQAARERLTMRGFFSHAASRMFSMDRGFLRTFVQMFTEPGDVPRRYVQGKRKWYTNPLSYWLVAATVQLLALNLIEEGYLTYVQANLESQMATLSAEETLDVYREVWKTDDPIPILAGIMLNSVKAMYTYMGIFFALAMGFCLNLFMRRTSEGYNFAEQFVFSLFVIGHWTMFTGLILPFTFRISPVLHSTIGIGGYFLIFAVASLGFHEEGARGVLKTMICLAVSFLAYLVVLMLVMMVFVVFEILQAGS